MIEYNKISSKKIKHEGTEVDSFVNQENQSNIDWETVKSFGEEWNRFNYFNTEEINRIGSEYFDIVTPEMLNKTSNVLDIGCGSGRWIKYIADKVNRVEGIDPSHAVFTAARFLENSKNTRITHAEVDHIPFENNTFDFVYSLGVLHHIPDTQSAMQRCIEKLKPGGYFLVYLYYSLDNRGVIFKLLFKASNVLRWMISRLPRPLKMFMCDFLTIFAYYPFILLTRLFLKIPGLKKWADHIPLSWYADKTFRVVRNDSLDRFGTPLEQRFSRREIQQMMENAGLEAIIFSEKQPYWHAVGRKKV